jgi:hypothetical protein
MGLEREGEWLRSGWDTEDDLAIKAYLHPKEYADSKVSCGWKLLLDYTSKLDKNSKFSV